MPKAVVKVVKGVRKRHKYGAIRSTAYGFTFDSKFERAHADELQRRKRAGEIADWCRPPATLLVDAPLFRDRISLRVDFHVTNLDGSTEYHETKGKVTEGWTLKRRLWMAYGPPEPLLVFYQRPAGRVERIERRGVTPPVPPPISVTSRRRTGSSKTTTASAKNSASTPAGRSRSKRSATTTTPDRRERERDGNLLD